MTPWYKSYLSRMMLDLEPLEYRVICRLCLSTTVYIASVLSAVAVTVVALYGALFGTLDVSDKVLCVCVFYVCWTISMMRAAFFSGVTWSHKCRLSQLPQHCDRECSCESDQSGHADN